ncbi:hypothetical protein BKA61DRAFT_705992 [Leptodontidium sp. MPI-SDFR-AT-0119]|nr:hypothetical protein BKA61DRAFT_705992 [Leptodontidium sp. MPI-SDFR-AT-0119]
MFGIVSNAQDQELKARALEDTLPPFSTLTTDDERERKAESQDPRIFVVVANLTSFADLPEYRDESIESIRRRSRYSEHNSNNYEQNSLSSSLVEEADDPNVVILKTFEDPFRTALTQVPFRPVIMPIAPAKSNLPSSNTVSLLDTARRGGKDADLLQYYRTAISPQIIRIGKSQGDEDMFEVQARQYPPLFHAMIALSALSIVHKKGSHNTNALEYYQQVIPAL